MIYNAVFWWNALPALDGVSKTLSPRALVTGFELDFNHHCRLEFGTYVQTHEQTDNTMRPRTVGAIALRPTGNSQGGYYFLSLNTGRRISRNHWTPLPMTQETIDRVHTLARRSKSLRGLIWDNITPFCERTAKFS